MRDGKGISLEGLTVHVAGHKGLVGSAVARRLAAIHGLRLLTRTRAEVDLTDPVSVEQLYVKERPDLVIMAAGKVGGIRANATFPASFIHENLMIETTLIHNAWKTGVNRLLNFGSSCMYPKRCQQPMAPDQLMTGSLEPTSKPYAVAKLAGWTLCHAYNRQYGTRYLTVIPCTLYGPGDRFDPMYAHVLSALLRKFHEAVETRASEVVLWGSGQARRGFLYVDDLAEACELILRSYQGLEPVNVGSGVSYPIAEVAHLIAEIVGFHGTIHWDRTQPDGAQEKQLDSSVVRRLGWVPRMNLGEGLEHTYRWFLTHARTSPEGDPVCTSS